MRHGVHLRQWKINSLLVLQHQSAKRLRWMNGLVALQGLDHQSGHLSTRTMHMVYATVTVMLQEWST